MKTLRVLCISLFVLVAIGCDSTAPDTAEDLLVVEAFLFAGEPVNDVRLKRAIPFGSADSSSVPVNDASVTLMKAGTSYPLTASGADGFYAYDGEDLTIETGDTFLLSIDYNGTTITATTTVPGPPQNVQLPSSEMPVPNFAGIGFGGGGGNFDSLSEFFTVTWDNPAANYHFVVVTSDDPEDPDFILPDFVRDFIGDFEIISEPTTADFHDIIPVTLSWLGPHYVTVYQINQEYVDLYENREQDSRDLTEPPSNIEGGLGVFTAFNGVVSIFDVVRESL
ncbi:MAG: DUF4249 family protein [Bacteroidota bacterium]